MSKKVAAFLSVAVVAVVVCASAGYLLWNGGRGGVAGAAEYWFYIDHGGAAPDFWISAEGDDAHKAFLNALIENGIDHDVDSEGWVQSIDGVGPQIGAVEAWHTWEWRARDGSHAAWREIGGILRDSTETIFYVGVTEFTFIDFEHGYALSLDPNAQHGWQGGGPFSP
ncbi:MAG: hypothetical protein FWH47_04560 [Methanomassiliicoccaceae archaeon]|nr:hypothetical protein [Methanomassiliicoccaceae archaeon]